MAKRTIAKPAAKVQPHRGETWRYNRIPALTGEVWFVGPGDTVHVHIEDDLGVFTWVSTVAAFLQGWVRVEESA